MSPRLTPWIAWAGLALIGLTALVLLGGAVGLRWDPLGLDARRLVDARQRADRAEADALARWLETEGERQNARRIDLHHQQIRAVEATTADARAHAEQAHDALQDIDPARALRLGDHDRELCRIAPHLAGCAAAP